MTMTTRTSALERLRALDEVFSLADIQANFGFDDRQARLYASRWAEGGLARRFGGGVYFNLVRNERGPERLTAVALDKLLRVPGIVVGGSALHAGGWTTQVHRRLEIAVPVMRGSLTVPSTSGDVVLTPRYPNWFRAIANSADGSAGDGLKTSAPEMALADALLAGRRSLSRKRPVSAPPPDEIDMGGFDADALDSVRSSMRALGGSEDEIAELTAPYEDVVCGTSDTMSF